MSGRGWFVLLASAVLVSLVGVLLLGCALAGPGGGAAAFAALFCLLGGALVFGALAVLEGVRGGRL